MSRDFFIGNVGTGEFYRLEVTRSGARAKRAKLAKRCKYSSLNSIYILVPFASKNLDVSVVAMEH